MAILRYRDYDRFPLVHLKRCQSGLKKGTFA
jgi:hypothetical protein